MREKLVRNDVEISAPAVKLNDLRFHPRSVSGLAFNGNALQASNGQTAVLRLTPESSSQRGSVWYNVKQTVSEGFVTFFQFQTTPPGGSDGFAFVIQNSATSALGGIGGYLGYDGIPNSIAVEFDTYQNSGLFVSPQLGDLSNREISVHTNGASANSANEQYSLSPGAIISPVPFHTDGAIHNATVIYGLGVLRIFIDDTSEPILSMPLDLASTLSLSAGTAYVGFTAATGTGAPAQNHDILRWSFAAESQRPSIVRNGDFSNGLYNWTATRESPIFGIRGEYPIFEILTGNPAGAVDCTPTSRQGNPFLSIDIPFGTRGHVEQSVRIPRSGGRLSLVSWGNENNDPAYGTSGLVNAEVTIVDNLGTEHNLDSFTPPPMLNPGDPTDPYDDTCTGNDPASRSYELSQYSGQTVKLRLSATSQNCCGTNAFFDDVYIEAQVMTFQCPPRAGFQARSDYCALPNAKAGKTYSYDLKIAGGSPPYSSAIIIGCCPNGLTNFSPPPRISGTPTQPGVYPMLLRIEDSTQEPFKNRVFVWVSLTVTPIITDLSRYSGVRPLAGPADGGTPANITGMGFTGVTGVKFNSTAVACGLFGCDFNVISDNLIQIKTPKSERSCGFLCSETVPGMTNVTVVLSNYVSGFRCSSQASTTEIPRCNQFKYIKRDRQPDCKTSSWPRSAELNFEAAATYGGVKADINLTGSMSVTSRAGFCVLIDKSG